VAGLLAVGYLQVALLDVGVPLWVDAHTNAPHAIVAVVFAVNCVLVVVLQVRFARVSRDTAVAARLARRGGATLFVACAIFAAAAIAGLPAIAAAAIILLAGVVHVFAELQQAAGEWTLSLDLAPDHAQGQYQGLMSSAGTAGATLGPITMAAVVALGPAGWLALGAVFLAAGAATVPATRWASATRSRVLSGVGTTQPE
jgi:MFS family permease